MVRPNRAILRDVLAALEEPSREPRAVLDATPEALIAFAADRRILGANAAAELLFGYGRGELDG
ncbi:MAG TPA: PAS domain-containing protein, partial [Polyangia bacterium]|nr:PAS domain-containing protein [Polyangia bacterium]